MTEQELPQSLPQAPKGQGVNRASDEDVKLAQLLFSRALTTDQIGKEVGLAGGQVRRISRGECRPQVKKLVEALYQELIDADKAELLHARGTALKVFVDGMKDPDKWYRASCARDIRRELALAGVGISIGDVDGSVVFIDAAQAAIIFKGGRKDEVPKIIEQGEVADGE